MRHCEESRQDIFDAGPVPKAPTLQNFGPDRWMDSRDSLADSMDQLMECA